MSIDSDPFAQFDQWYDEAAAHPSIADHTEMALATADENGAPSIRMVLLKGHDSVGFRFFTNLSSRKSLQIKQNPNVALLFYWNSIGRQIRIEGVASQVSDVQADEYFASRHRESQIGAWASRQSAILENGRSQLLAKCDEMRDKFKDEEAISRPDFWSGWEVAPNYFEFWQSGEYRIHDRVQYVKNQDGWQHNWLYP